MKRIKFVVLLLLLFMLVGCKSNPFKKVDIIGISKEETIALLENIYESYDKRLYDDNAKEQLKGIYEEGILQVNTFTSIDDFLLFDIAKVIAAFDEIKTIQEEYDKQCQSFLSSLLKEIDELFLTYDEVLYSDSTFSNMNHVIEYEKYSLIKMSYQELLVYDISTLENKLNIFFYKEMEEELSKIKIIELKKDLILAVFNLFNEMNYYQDDYQALFDLYIEECNEIEKLSDDQILNYQINSFYEKLGNIPSKEIVDYQTNIEIRFLKEKYKNEIEDYIIKIDKTIYSELSYQLILNMKNTEITYIETMDVLSNLKEYNINQFIQDVSKIKKTIKNYSVEDVKQNQIVFKCNLLNLDFYIDSKVIDYTYKNGIYNLELNNILPNVSYQLKIQLAGYEELIIDVKWDSHVTIKNIIVADLNHYIFKMQDDLKYINSFIDAEATYEVMFTYYNTQNILIQYNITRFFENTTYFDAHIVDFKQFYSVTIIKYINENIMYEEIHYNISIVEIDVEAIEIECDQITLIQGETFQINYVATPIIAYDKSVICASSNSKVAKVVDLVITALIPGNTTITITNGSISKTITVVVNSYEYKTGQVISQIDFEDYNLTQNLVLTTSLDGVKVTWTSNSPAIVINGNIAIVNRQFENVEVILTARFEYLTYSQTKTYTFIVLKNN